MGDDVVTWEDAESGPAKEDMTIMLDLREYVPKWHAPGSKAALGQCTWHGVENCSESPRWSFRYLKTDAVNEKQAACDRGLEEAMLQGLIVGQRTPRAARRSVPDATDAH